MSAPGPKSMIYKHKFSVSFIRDLVCYSLKAKRLIIAAGTIITSFRSRNVLLKETFSVQLRQKSVDR